MVGRSDSVPVWLSSSPAQCNPFANPYIDPTGRGRTPYHRYALQTNMGSWKQPSLPEADHVQVFKGGISVVMPALPLAVRPVSAVGLGEVRDLTVHRGS